MPTTLKPLPRSRTVTVVLKFEDADNTPPTPLAAAQVRVMALGADSKPAAKLYAGRTNVDGKLIVSLPRPPAFAGQPAAPLPKLAEILDEMQKTVEVLDAEMVRYLSLHFYSEESIAQGRVVLLGMEVGQSIIRIGAARGHCHRMKNIYDTYLNKLFDKIFKSDPATRNQLATTFEGLGTLDDYIIGAMKEVSDWLTLEAQQTLDLVDFNNLAGANLRIQQARLDARPARIVLTKAMADLRGLQADLIATAGTV